MSKFIPNGNSYIGFTPGPVGALAAPTTPTATAAGAGNLPAASYAYKVSAVDEYGESLPSSSASVTSTAAGGVDIAWATVDGAEGYNIYGRSGGHFYFIQAVGGDAVSWHDDGSRVPNANATVSAQAASNIHSPRLADIQDAVDLTRFCTEFNATTTGNTVPTPSFDTLFERSIAGTVTASFSASFYRDDENDLAWDTLPRGTEGFFFARRFGKIPKVAGQKIEVWPVRVTARSMANMANNTAETLTVTAAVPEEPDEDAVIAA